MHKKKLSFVNPSKCMITTGCPFYTNETIEKTGETIADVVSELISKIKQREAIDMMQEIKNRISEMQTYTIYLDEKYISRDEVLRVVDEKIKECQNELFASSKNKRKR